MTVCIASTNIKHNVLVFATDRMVTTAPLPIEFEHKIPKIAEITKYCVGLVAGSALRGKGIFEAVQDQTGGKSLSIHKIAQTAKIVYQNQRLQIIEDIFLKSKGLSLQLYTEKGKDILPLSLHQQLDRQISTFNFQLEVIIAGVDEHGPHIYSIYNPGFIECYDSIGFHAVGTGALHILASLYNVYDPECIPAESIYCVLRAKRDAEIAPGVGQRTDLGIIDNTKKLKYFAENADLFKKFDELYRVEKEGRKTLTKASEFAKIAITDNSQQEKEAGCKEVANAEKTPEKGKPR